jgi:hypothetical protein
MPVRSSRVFVWIRGQCVYRAHPRTRDTTVPEQPPTLRDMIQEALDSGDNLRTLAAKAIDPATGETVGKDTINKIRHGTAPRMPEDGKLRAIAAALRAPYDSVRQAAMAQWFPDEAGCSATSPPPPGFDPKLWQSYDDMGRQAILDALRIADRRRLRNPPDEGARTRTG